MKTSEYKGSPLGDVRSHPWTTASGDTSCRYHDFTTTPALIRTSLEDFLPWVRYPAIERFYLLLEWLNDGTASLFESNDCEFTGPHSNEHPAMDKAQQCTGRVMVLFRALHRNTLAGEVEALSTLLHRELALLDPGFEYGIIGTTCVPTRYLKLLASGQPPLGEQLMLSFWAWGETELDTMTNLERLFRNLQLGLSRVAARLG